MSRGVLDDMTGLARPLTVAVADRLDDVGRGHVAELVEQAHRDLRTVVKILVNARSTVLTQHAGSSPFPKGDDAGRNGQHARFDACRIGSFTFPTRCRARRTTARRTSRRVVPAPRASRAR